MDICDFRRLFKSLYIYLSIIDSDVPGYGFREYHSILHYHSTMASPPFEIVFIDITSGYKD